MGLPQSGQGSARRALSMPRVKAAIVEEHDAGFACLSACLLSEVGEGDEDAHVPGQPFAHESSHEPPDIVDADLPGDPALALDDLSLAVAGQFKVYAPVRAVLATRLFDLPAFSPEQLPDEPLELRRGEEAQVGGPFDETASKVSVALDKDPGEADYRRHHCGNGVRLDKVPNSPVERERQREPSARINDERRGSHRPPGPAAKPRRTGSRNLKMVSKCQVGKIRWPGICRPCLGCRSRRGGL